MGTALMMEGLLSACYHVCPNYTNFQFGKTACIPTNGGFKVVVHTPCRLKVISSEAMETGLPAVFALLLGD